MRKNTIKIAATALLSWTLAMTSGCGENDGRLARMAAEAARQQAAQNEEIARLNREVAAGTKQLVEGDAKARQELIAAQRDLQRQQEQVGAQRDALEAERKQWAQQRRTESVYGPILSTLGMTLLALLPLVLCWCLLQGLGRTDEEQIGEILIEEIVSEEPQLLPAPPTSSPSRLLEHQSELAEQDGADESTLPS